MHRATEMNAERGALLNIVSNFGRLREEDTDYRVRVLSRLDHRKSLGASRDLG